MPAVQALVEHDDAGAVVEEELAACAVAVEEEDDGAAQGVQAELLAGDGDEGVEGAPEVYGVDGGVEGACGRDENHGASSARSSAATASVVMPSGKRRRWPLRRRSSKAGCCCTAMATRRVLGVVVPAAVEGPCRRLRHAYRHELLRRWAA